MSQLCISVTMKNLKSLLHSVSPNVVVSIRGRHAIGKSEAVAQFANEIGLPLQMRRLSQMTEGDMLGLPSEVKVGDRKATTFNPCEWFLEACEKPMVLFLDERNRALDAVKQSIFEICDSRQFYGHKLHPETRVIIAENVGDSYQVQQCDPAEVSRTVTVELDTTYDEWLEYAKTRCHEAVVDFIRQEGEKVLEFRGANGVYEPNKKYPDRRSWMKLNDELVKGNVFDNEDTTLLRIMAAGFLGPETGIKFEGFVKNRDRQVSAKEVLQDWKKAKARLSNKGTREISNEKYVELTAKISDLVGKKDFKMSENQADQIADFLKDCPPEPRMNCFSSLQNNIPSLLLVHKRVSLLIASTANGETVEALQKKKDAAAAGSTKKSAK